MNAWFFIMGRRQVVSQRLLVPSFRRFESYRPSPKEIPVVPFGITGVNFCMNVNIIKKGAFHAEGASCLLYAQRSS